ncbi:MAG: 1-deoxy-D-xylulose 5-phosphate reductoisomerase [Chloroflexi bacterium]|nr:1-deoxy-D-xylulose 5-phosphate reductoisomerase [Chloroflexota bacterium]
MKRVVVLGSTGSVGSQALDVVERLPDELHVVGLAAGHWSTGFAAQLDQFQPELAALGGNGARTSGPSKIHVLTGPTALEELVNRTSPDVLVLATPGLVGLSACLSALRRAATVAVANKETLVSAGDIVTRTAAECGGTIVPVDSEHSGIWQCLRGEDSREIAQLVLTSSGGAFRDTPLDRLSTATPEEALKHPTWSMGPKITVDSATLMNKGLEIIEAMWLFGVPASKVSVVLHRQSIVHALVEFVDGSVKAQLSVPDMRLPIIDALTHPRRVNADLPRLDIANLGALTFEPIDDQRFPSVLLARHAALAGGTYPAVMNAANEVAVERFLARDLRFTDIVPLISATLDQHDSNSGDCAADFLAADAWARNVARTTSARH